MEDYEDVARCWVCDTMLTAHGNCRECEYLENAGERLDPGGYARDAEIEALDPFYSTHHHHPTTEPTPNRQ